MSLDVVAVPRSKGVVLAAVLSEDGPKGGLRLVAEDGARFTFPAEHALARCRSARAGDPDAPVEKRLAALRRALTPFDAWLPLRAGQADGARTSLADVARGAGLPADTGPLAVALGVPRAAPWFRRDGDVLVAVPMRTALEGLFRQHEERFRKAGDDAVRGWWPRRDASIPDGWVDPAGDVGLNARVTLEKARWFEPDYEPDLGVAGAASLASLASFAIGGTHVAGAELARSLGLPEDPDQVLEQLVACGVLSEDVEPAPARAGLTEPFPEEALAQARAPAAPLSGPREDMTHELAVAVDDADTREVDDALTIRREGEDVVLHVHIADVAAHVAPGTPLDAAARARAASLFLPDRSVLMFPEDLVVERLSLTEGADRPALTGIFRIDADGEVREARFVRSTVRLARRVTYDATHDLAALARDAGDGELLVRVAEALRAARERRGARVLRLPSLKVTVEEGVPALGLRLQDTPGDLVVSEAMVLFNTQAGELLATAGVPALYRSQAADVPAGREVPSTDDPLYAHRIRRTFAPTETSVEPHTHAGLGAPAYVQCTSPIRRFADLVNQRQLAAAAAGGDAPHGGDELAELLPLLHERERAIRQAADARTQTWVARAVLASGRPTFRGLLSRSPRRGMGGVWVPELCRELPLRAPREWRPPPEGTEAEWRVAAVRPFRGRIELAPLAP